MLFSSSSWGTHIEGINIHIMRIKKSKKKHNKPILTFFCSLTISDKLLTRSLLAPTVDTLRLIFLPFISFAFKQNAFEGSSVATYKIYHPNESGCGCWACWTGGTVCRTPNIRMVFLRCVSSCGSKAYSAGGTVCHKSCSWRVFHLQETETKYKM